MKKGEKYVIKKGGVRHVTTSSSIFGSLSKLTLILSGW